MRVQTSGDGVKLDVDLDRVDPSLQGRLSLHFEYAIAAQALTLLPKPSLLQLISDAFVCRAPGVNAHEPPEQ